MTADLTELAHLRSINLGAPNVTMSGLILGVDCNRQGLDGVHMDGRHLFDVLAVLDLSAPHFVQSLFVKAVEQMNHGCDQQAQQDERKAAAGQGGIKKNCRSRTGYLRRERPNEALL